MQYLVEQKDVQMKELGNHLTSISKCKSLQHLYQISRIECVMMTIQQNDLTEMIPGPEELYNCDWKVTVLKNANDFNKNKKKSVKKRFYSCNYRTGEQSVCGKCKNSSWLP